MNEAPTTPAWDDVMVPNYGTPGLHLVSGQDCTVTDRDGKEYTDLLGGIAVNVLGHAHPRVIEAVGEQIGLLGHVSNLYAHDPGLHLAARLRELAGGRHKALFTNSGTEANEAAFKLVRKHATDQGKEGVVLSFQGSFHGRTMGALALTGQPHHQEGFGPLPQGIVHVPFNDPAALEAAFDQHTVLGVFMEPVQGEGGVVPVDQITADTLARLCDRDGALLIADEVQTGVGRTGRFFAHEHLGLRPHVITLAKALGGGMPIGACLIHDDLATALGPGSHGCTFGGHPVSAAAALATLDVLAEAGLIESAAEKGAALAGALAEEGIEAHGLGLLMGITVEDAGSVQKRMQDAGYLVGVAGKKVVRFAPPLTITTEALLDAVPVLVASIRAQETTVTPG